MSGICIGGRDDSPGDPLNDKENFSALLREMRAAFDAAEADGSTGDLGRLMMTAAVSASWKTIDLVHFLFDYMMM